MSADNTMTARKSRRPRAQDADRYVGARVRERRTMLGISQQQMAQLIGVTYQQEHKYENGSNRVSVGRLYQIARVLGVDIGYFYDGFQSERAFVPTTQQRLLLELSRNFVSIANPEHREMLVELARVLAGPTDLEDLPALHRGAA